jgi:hypothetical protein
MTLTRAVLAVSLVATAACSPRDDGALAAAAKALHSSAESCLLSVRDSRAKYEESPPCNALRALSLSYTQAGGFTDEEPNDSKVLATEARLMAWQALAISESQNPALSIW